ncbi:MAG: hypothetical protein AAGE52_24555 [Myxococcota bacterium]
MRDRAVAAVTLIASTLFLFAPWFVGALTGEPRWFEWDVPEQYWPDLVYLCGNLHEGDLPYWNPYDRAGYPYYADPQAAPYHPMNWALCALGGSSPAIVWAELRTILAFPLTGFFGLLWLRRLGATSSGALLGAVTLLAAPFLRHNWELNLTTAFAWAPLMLWSVERLITERRVFDGALAALAFAGCAWVGSPPALWQASTFTLLYALIRTWSEIRSKDDALALGRASAVAILFAVGWVGVVFVPGLTLAEHSVQAGRSFESIASGALEVGDLGALFRARSGNHLYVGWLPLALAPFAIVARPKLAGPIAAVGILAVLLTLGGSVFRLAYSWVPGVDLFRSPHRYEAWLGPVAAILAAFGLPALAKRITPSALLVGGAALVAGVLAAFEQRGPAALALGVAILSLAGSQVPRAWVGALLAIVLLYDVSAALPAERHTRGGPHPAIDAPLPPNVDHDFRYMDEFVLSCRSGTRLGAREFRGYQDPLTLKSFERVLAALQETPELAMQYNVRYALQGPHFIHGFSRGFLPSLESRPWTEGPPNKRVLQDALPFAYWVGPDATAHVPRREDALALVRTHAPAAIAVLEGALEGEGRATPQPRDALASATRVRVGQDELRFQIDAPGDGWVVINEAWYPGWRAWVGEQEVVVRRANALVRAIPVPAGSHDITLRFEPAEGSRWRIVWGATWLLFAGFGVARIRRRS